jgi:hypothetical protein
MSPTTESGRRSYNLVGGPFMGEEGSQFGSGVGVYEKIAGGGAPNGNEGVVITFQAVDAAWKVSQELGVNSEDNLFGASVGMSAFGMVVGAPGFQIPGSSTATGAAFFYQYNPMLNIWSQLGSTMYGMADFGEPNEGFGSAVSVSTTQRIAVGAPMRDQGSGAIYCFEYGAVHTRSLDWQPLSNQTLSIAIPNDALGASVDISQDGYRIIGTFLY